MLLLFTSNFFFQPKYTHRIKVKKTGISDSLDKADGQECVILDSNCKGGKSKIKTKSGDIIQVPSDWLVSLDDEAEKEIEEELVGACICPWSFLVRGCECGGC